MKHVVLQNKNGASFVGWEMDFAVYLHGVVGLTKGSAVDLDRFVGLTMGSVVDFDRFAGLTMGSVADLDICWHKTSIHFGLGLMLVALNSDNVF